MIEGPENSETIQQSNSSSPDGARSYLLQASALLGVIAITVIITLWVSRDSDREGVEILIPPPDPVTFQVSGEVMHPGVYSLDGEPRINDIIDAAGGLTPDANTDQINLALIVRDGAKVVIPSDSPVDDSKPGSGAVSNVTSNDPLPPASSDGSGLIDLNTASKEQLVALPGVGDVRADSIIEWRENNLINSTNDLLAISGIGLSTVNSIRDFVIQP